MVVGFSSTLKKKVVKSFRKLYDIPKGVTLHLFKAHEQACAIDDKEICLYEQTLESGLRFLVALFIWELLNYINIALVQLMPNSLRIFVWCMILWVACNDSRDKFIVSKFLFCYNLVEESGWWYFTTLDQY